MRKIAALLVAASFVGAPLLAAAQEANPPQYPPPPQYAPPPQYPPPQGYPPPQARPADFQRHLGFFIRPELGVGYVSSSATFAGTDWSLSGAGGTFGLAIGGALSENFIVGFHVWDVVATSPDLTVGGQTATTSSDTSSGVVGYGVLLNWYFMPSNIYFAVTPSLTRLVVSDSSGSGNSEWGFGLRAALGKEWWVSDHWGLGVNGSLAFSSNKDSSASGAPDWSTFGFAVALSATYN